MSVDLGWSKGQRNKEDLKSIALSFLDLKNREIHCTYKTHLSIKEFLSLLQNLKAKGIVLLDIPLKGKADGFFRPVERALQRVGIPCRPSKNALIKGKKLLSKIEALGFKAIEIYPFEFYKFYSLLPTKNSDPSRKRVSESSRNDVPTKKLHIAPVVFRMFFPPYKRAGEEGFKNAERIIDWLLDFLKLKLTGGQKLMGKSRSVKWDIYDSIFGVIAGYLLLKHSPWIKFIRDKTGSEILILSDENLDRITRKNFGSK